MPTPSNLKHFIIISCVVFIFYVFALFCPSRTMHQPTYREDLLKLEQSEKGESQIPNLAAEDIKYILQWTSAKVAPFSWMGRGRSAFLKNRCEFTNCYVTDDREHFQRVEKFDAVVFHGKDLLSLKRSELPVARSVKQKYIFAMMESAHNYPVCEPRFDDYFNWTWSYRLDSNVRLGYITAYETTSGRVIAPSVNTTWSQSYKPIPEDLNIKLKSKSKTAAWFVSNCRTKGKREIFGRELVRELSAKYNLTVDIYGGCGTLKCPRSTSASCNEMLQKDYYFYFSFENSFDRDYVTEKVLTALNNLVVPIVYGGANYSRFLPPGSYLNGRELGVNALARVISQIRADPSRYADMFRWRTIYHYRDTSSNVDICNLCAIMNDKSKFETSSVYHRFRQWWNVKDVCS